MKPCPIDVLEASAAASGDGEADWAGTSDCDTLAGNEDEDADDEVELAVPDELLELLELEPFEGLGGGSIWLCW